MSWLLRTSLEGSESTFERLHLRRGERVPRPGREAVRMAAKSGCFAPAPNRHSPGDSVGPRSGVNFHGHFHGRFVVSEGGESLEHTNSSVRSGGL